MKASHDTASYVDEAIQTAVQKISGNLGGYVILHDTDDDGYPDELLIMDTDDITTATNVWRWSQQGLMHANSYTGTYANAAITMDGQIVADAITTGTLRGIRIISDDGAGNTVDLVDGMVTVESTVGTYAGKARMHSRYFQVTSPNDTILAQLAAGWSSDDLLHQQWGGVLTLYDALGRERVRASSDGIYYYDAVSANRLVEMTASSTGGTWRTYWPDGSTKIYLGTLTQQTSYGYLLNDTPSLAFYKNNGNGTSSIKSWYTMDRAFIADETFTDSSGNPDPSKFEYGYVCHGHSASHGYTFGFASTGTPGASDYRTYLWVYVDGESLGYIPITASSDAQFKSNVNPISEAYKRAVERVELDSFFYDFTTPIKASLNTELRFGIIAQDLIAALESEGIDPMESELIATAPDPDGERYLVNYTPFLVARLAADEDRIKELEDRLAALEARLEV